MMNEADVRLWAMNHAADMVKVNLASPDDMPKIAEIMRAYVLQQEEIPNG